jgi:drug/metabolite transporter (DMT)-like permease
MKKSGVPFQVFLILLFSEVCDAFAQYCFKRSSDSMGSFTISNFSDAIAFARGCLHSWHLGVGIATVGLVFLLWMTVLSKIDLSVAMPLTSCSYIFVALTAMFFLGEHISLLRWLGILCILAGVVVVTRSADEEGHRPGPLPEVRR